MFTITYWESVLRLFFFFGFGKKDGFILEINDLRKSLQNKVSDD